MLYILATEKHYQQEFKQFKHIAIVLHHPKDTWFKRKLRDQFKYLDAATGKSFLFISFINRPEGWKPGWDIDKDGCNVLRASGNDDQRMMFEFCQRAEISTSNLPKILLLENLNAKELIAIPTNKESVGDQLVSIGQFCDSQEECITTEKMAQFITSSYPNCTCSRIMLAEPVSTILTELYAAQEAYDDKSFLYQKPAQEYVRNASMRLQDVYQNASEEQREKALSNWMNYEALCANFERKKAHDTDDMLSAMPRHSYAMAEKNERPLEFKLNLPRKYEAIVPSPSLTVKKNWIRGCELDSELNIDRLNDLNYSRKFQRRNLFHRFADFDESMYAKYLGQFMEDELNCSLVQHIREILGIPMPKYYNTYYPDRGNYNITLDNNHIVQFNWHEPHSDKLKHVSAGDLKAAYQKMLDDIKKYPGLKDLGKDFLQCIFQIYKRRNMGGHWANSFTHEDAEDMYAYFVDFLRDYFPKLVELKEELKR